MQKKKNIPDKSGLQNQPRECLERKLRVEDTMS